MTAAGETTTQYYVRGAGGALQAIYQTVVNLSTESETDVLLEMPLYGAGRLGMAYYQSGVFDYHYELSDHLGNVRAVIRKDITVLGSPKEVLSYSDYYPN